VEYSGHKLQDTQWLTRNHRQRRHRVWNVDLTHSDIIRYQRWKIASISLHVNSGGSLRLSNAGKEVEDEL
jgi:hypothetical protein